MPSKVFLVIAACLSLVSCMQIQDIEEKVSEADQSLLPGCLETGKEVEFETVHQMKIIEEEFKKLEKDMEIRSNSSCYCAKYTCGCCLQLVVKSISLNETGCMNVSYLPDEYGFQMLFTLNGKIIINKKISVKNPPPICAPIPYSHLFATVCIRFYNLDYKAKQFSGCADIEIEAEGVVVEKYDLGCIHIPPGRGLYVDNVRHLP